MSLSEALYWPVLHAASAVTGGGAARGREIAARQAACALVAVAGPLVGGWILTRFGPGANFALAGALFMLSGLPVMLMEGIPAGPVPTAGNSPALR